MKLKDFLDYLNERFAWINMALFAVLFFTVAGVVITEPELSFDTMTRILPVALLGGIPSIISFFFRLRVMDEIKDFDKDLINHPNRVLQSGRIQLKDLIIISSVGTLLEIAWSVIMGWSTLAFWLLCLGYSLLMRYEFFAPRFLNQYLVLYALSHLLIMPLVIIWVWSAFRFPSLTTKLLLLCCLSIFNGFAFEIARKIHAPQAENPRIDSYSKSIGYLSSIRLVSGVVLLGGAVQLYLLYLLQSNGWPYFVIPILCLAVIIYYFTASKHPNEATLRKAETWVSALMAVSYIVILFNGF